MRHRLMFMLSNTCSHSSVYRFNRSIGSNSLLLHLNLDIAVLFGGNIATGLSAERSPRGQILLKWHIAIRCVFYNSILLVCTML